MHEMTKREVKKILANTSHVLVVEDFDDVVALDRLAGNLIKRHGDGQRLINSPFVLCGIKFYPLTIAKSIWYAEKLAEWDLEPHLHDCFLYWLLTLPLTDSATDPYEIRKDASRAVRALSKKMHCTPKEMNEVFAQCIGKTDTEVVRLFMKEPPPELATALETAFGASITAGGITVEFHKETGSVDYGAVLAMLLREYGGTPDQWLYETPLETIASLVEQHTIKIHAEHNAVKSTSKKAVAPKATPKLAALREFREKCNELTVRWSSHG